MKNVNAMLNQTFVNQQRFQERLAQLKTQHRPPQQRVVKSKVRCCGSVPFTTPLRFRNGFL